MLTPKERQVLRLLASGMDQRKIAERLGVSPRTIEAHTKHLRAKTGAQTTVHMAVMAATGEIDIGDE